MKTTTPIGAMLRLWRTVNGRTLRELAEDIGVSHSTLLRLEGGKTCDLDTWLVIERWLLGKAEIYPAPVAVPTLLLAGADESVDDSNAFEHNEE